MVSKPTTLESLTKAELIQLVKDRFLFVTEADLVRAQWTVSGERWKRLDVIARQAQAPLVELADAVNKAASIRAQAKALTRYKAARAVYTAAQDDADREWKRGEALYARLDSLHRAPEGRRLSVAAG